MQDFTCPALLRIPLYSLQDFVYRALTFYGRPSHAVLLSIRFSLWSYNPTMQASWFGLFPFRSPLLRESHSISFPPGTEMFHFPGLALFRVSGHNPRWVSPFGNLRIKASFQLPEAYRRLARPSSPLSAKASTVCP